MKRMLIAALAALFMLALAVPASALSQGDFVGKGEVQTFFGWNNAQLQANADSVLVTATTETTWTCSRTNSAGHEIVQERSSETTTSATTVARLKNQITGFHVGNITGTSTDGPAVGSCPSGAGAGWSYDNNAETSPAVYSFTLAQ